MPKVISVIVTYNGMSWIGKCLDSLINSTIPSSILVIDNGSTDGTWQHVMAEYPIVELIRTKSNLGYGQASNIGLKMAVERKADYMFTLNQDVWVDHDTLEKLLGVIEQNPVLGILSPLHFNGAGTALDKYFFNYLAKSETDKDPDFHARMGTVSPDTIYTPFINSACWLVTGKCIETIGGFSPVFFHYGEDENYAQRVLWKGLKIGIFTGTKAYHDREFRIGKPVTDPTIKLSKEWIHFLNQVCDMRQRNYKKLVYKRFLRYSFETVSNFVSGKIQNAQFSYRMARKIISSVGEIENSRRLSKASTI